MPVGTVLATVPATPAAPAAAPPAAAARRRRRRRTAGARARSPRAAAAPPAPAPARRGRASTGSRVSPLARRAAEQLGRRPRTRRRQRPERRDHARPTSSGVASRGAPPRRAAGSRAARRPRRPTPADRQAAMREAIARADGALQARDPPLLPRSCEIDMSRALDVAARGEPRAPGRPSGCCPSVLLLERGRPRGARDAGDERLLDRRRVPARRAASTSASRSRCAAAV